MRTLYRRILLFLYPYFLLTEVLTDLLIYYFIININPTPACSSVTDYLGSKPSRELSIILFHYSFTLNIQLFNDNFHSLLANRNEYDTGRYSDCSVIGCKNSLSYRLA